MTQISAHIMG